MKLKIDDEVKVLKGKDKGKTGKVEKVFPNIFKVQVAGVNTYKKHTKAKSKHPAGVIDIVKPLPVANVALLCPHCKKTTRIGYKLESSGKLRVCRKCNKTLEG